MDFLTANLANICPQHTSYAALPQEASTRRFYRVWQKDSPSVILMHITDQTHDITSIIQSQKKLTSCGIPTADIIDYSIEDNWIVQSDLGDSHLLTYASQRGFTNVYRSAISHIIRLQTRASDSNLPIYGRHQFLQEMELFKTEYLPALKLSNHMLGQINFAIRNLATEICILPTAVTHKDYHSTNLLVHQQQVHVVDQQDMCIGPWTYDLASLLFDCYIDWPEQINQLLLEDFYGLHPKAKDDLAYSVYLTALQRHLKCIGLFMRLGRNGKVRYLSYLPRLKKRVLMFCDMLPQYAVLKIPIEMGL